MQLVCSGASRSVDLRDGAAVLGVEQTGLDFEFLQGINGWQQHVAVEVQIRILDSIQRVVIEVDSLATDVQGEAVTLATHALLSLAGRRSIGCRARNERCQLKIVAAVEW